MARNNLSHSMRDNYGTHGVENYYRIVQESYRNPHYLGLKRVLTQVMDRAFTLARLANSLRLPHYRVLLFDTPPFPQPSIPEPELSIMAADPFTAPAYRARTGLPCLELSFADVAAGQLPAPGSSTAPEPGAEDVELFDVVIVSFALHLVESSSELWALLAELGKRARWLCVTAPHKKPDVKDSWGWRRWDPSAAWRPADGREDVGGEKGDGAEIVLERVRLRLWRSEANWEEQ
ncbi:hypothetical protein JCM10449v2_003809 [Rhodotorula kratochvilovae]